MLFALVAVLATGCGAGNFNSTGGSTPTAPVLSLSATTLSFGSIVVGASSAAQTLTVTNTGTAALAISNISIGGDFSQTNSGCTPSIAVNATCAISVIFTPTAVGARAGTLTLTSNATGSPQTVSLTGTGTAPLLGLSATSLSFGNVAVGVPSAAQTVTVTNTGTAPLTISNIAIAGDYADTNTGCSATLAVNASCQVAVTFTPTTTGSRAGTLTLTSNGSGSPQTVSLTGVGAAPVLGLSATTLSFGNIGLNTSSAAQTVTVTNTGTAPLTISNIAITGDYSDTVAGCSGSLAVNASCQIAVTFTPAAIGTRSGTLTLTSNGIGSPQTVSLAGAGTTAILSVSATTLNFGNIVVGATSAQQTLLLKNSGTAPLTISNIAITGDYSDNAGGCLATLAVNATCQIAVTFTPTLAGTRTGTLTLTSNGTGSPQTVSLTGIGTAPVLGLSATAFNFGNITVGTPSAPQILTITNTGTAPLTVYSITPTGDYSVIETGCTVTLAVNATCQVAITFTPTVAGTRNGMLTVTSDGLGSPQTVTLTGTATPVFFAFQIAVAAGSQPIVGAAVQVYAAGTTGNGSAPTALLSAPLTTSPSGAATIPITFVCPSGSPLLYAVSRGGTVTGASSANPNAVLMTALGPCSGIGTGSNFVVNEATTVAAVEALAPFYSVGGAIGATATNALGLANAMATAATLTDPVAGTSPGSSLPGNAASPAARVNSLANLLNGCVVSSAACASLYTDTAQGSTLATNTLDAAYYLAKNPAGNVAALYALSLASTAYTPVLKAVPTDWTMFVAYSGGGLNSPGVIGVDSQGNVWAASYNSSASKFTPTGAAVFPSGISGGGLNNSYGLAIDLNDNVWILNEQPFTSVGIGSVSEFSAAGTSLAGNGYINGGMDYPLAAAIDPNGTVWVLDFGNSHLTLLNPSGTPLSGTTGYTTSQFAFPDAVALDSNHFGWIANYASATVTKVAPDGSSFTSYNYATSATQNAASGIAIDQGDNVWVANYYNNSLSLLTNSGSLIASNYTANGAINHPQAIAVDGAGTVWVANYRAGYLSELAGASASIPGLGLSPAGGLGGDAKLLEAYSLALDASGNIWVSNQGNSTITKFIGLAVPVKTPLSGIPQLP